MAVVCDLAREIREFRAGNCKQIDDFENTKRVDDKKGDKPPLFTAIGGAPEREALPQQTP